MEWRRYAWLVWSPVHGLLEVWVTVDCAGAVTVRVVPYSVAARPLGIDLGGARGDAVTFDLWLLPVAVRDDELVNDALDRVEALLHAAHVLAEDAEETPCELHQDVA